MRRVGASRRSWCRWDRNGQKRRLIGRRPRPMRAPSGLSVTGEHAGRPTSEADVADTIDAFARTASDAERLGFDGVEVMGAHAKRVLQTFV